MEFEDGSQVLAKREDIYTQDEDLPKKVKGRLVSSHLLNSFFKGSLQLNHTHVLSNPQDLCSSSEHIKNWIKPLNLNWLILWMISLLKLENIKILSCSVFLHEWYCFTPLQSTASSMRFQDAFFTTQGERKRRRTPNSRFQTDYIAHISPRTFSRISETHSKAN